MYELNKAKCSAKVNVVWTHLPRCEMQDVSAVLPDITEDLLSLRFRGENMAADEDSKWKSSGCLTDWAAIYKKCQKGKEQSVFHVYDA